jgi:hypothetical protein
MIYQPVRILLPLAATLLLIGCPSQPTRTAEAPPAAQNLIGSTDELQLVTELSLELARVYGAPKVLVALEIDDTLLMQDGSAGCSEAVMRPLQADAAQQVQRMQEAGLRVIALTSRDPECGQHTLQELSRNGFNFQPSAWPPADGFAAPTVLAGGDREVDYRQGVFMAGAQDKGLALKGLLDQSGSPYPTLIVLTDREQSDLNAVMKAFSFTGTKVQAWRYTRMP